MIPRRALLFTAVLGLTGCPTFECGDDQPIESYCGRESWPCPTEDDLHSESTILAWTNQCMDGWDDGEDMEGYGCIAKDLPGGCTVFSYYTSGEGSEGNDRYEWQFGPDGSLVYHYQLECSGGEESEEGASFGQEVCVWDGL